MYIFILFVSTSVLSDGLFSLWVSIIFIIQTFPFYTLECFQISWEKGEFLPLRYSIEIISEFWEALKEIGAYSKAYLRPYQTQRDIEDRVRHLWWSFLAKIVNSFKTVYYFRKKWSIVDVWLSSNYTSQSNEQNRLKIFAGFPFIIQEILTSYYSFLFSFDPTAKCKGNSVMFWVNVRRQRDPAVHELFFIVGSRVSIFWYISNKKP